MSMDIYTKPGNKVVVTSVTSRNGMPQDIINVKNRLQVGKKYTIDLVFRGESRTEVVIRGVAGKFNSVNFDNA